MCLIDYKPGDTEQLLFSKGVKGERRSGERRTDLYFLAVQWLRSSSNTGRIGRIPG